MTVSGGAPLPPSVLLIGLTDSQFAPSTVVMMADQVPIAPQFVSPTVCGAGSLTFCTPLNVRVPGEPFRQPA